MCEFSRRYEFPRTFQVFMEILKFLVLSCRYESPRTFVPFCIFVPHWRTRRSVISIWVSRLGFPILLLKNQTFSDWVLWVSTDGWMHLDSAQPKILPQHARPGSTSVFDFAILLLHPFRYRFRAAGKDEILSAANWAEMADVLQMEKIVPLITCEVAVCQYVCKLVFGVDVLDLNLGVQINSFKQPIKSNSVGPGNMSHCWTSSLFVHLDHCSVVFKNIQHGCLMIRVRVWGNKLNTIQIINLSMNFLSR